MLIYSYYSDYANTSHEIRLHPVTVVQVKFPGSFHTAYLELSNVSPNIADGNSNFAENLTTPIIRLATIIEVLHQRQP